MSFTQASRSFNVLAWRARNTPFTFSRRSAAFMITGESEWETGSPATPYTRLAFRGALQLEVEQLASCRGGLTKDLQLGGERPAKLAAVSLAPAGRDHNYLGMVFGKTFDLGKRLRRVRKVI